MLGVKLFGWLLGALGTCQQVLLYVIYYSDQHKNIPAGIYLLKLTIETIEQAVKYDANKYINDVVLASLFLTLNIFYSLF